MKMRGTKPTPAEVKIRQGMQERHPERVPQPTIIGGRYGPGDQLPEPPPDFTKDMKEVWRVAVKDLAQGGVLDKSDLTAVETFSRSLGRAREFGREIARQAKATGNKHYVVKGVRGSVANPIFGLERSALTEARLAGELLGLSPSARGRLGLKAGGQSAQAELERVLGKPQRCLRVVDGD
jgi:P27 family predicted phage terminase small subunit